MDDPTAVEVVDCAKNLDKQVPDMSLCVQISERAQTRTQCVRDRHKWVQGGQNNLSDISLTQDIDNNIKRHYID